MIWQSQVICKKGGRGQCPLLSNFPPPKPFLQVSWNDVNKAYAALVVVLSILGWMPLLLRFSETGMLQQQMGVMTLSTWNCMLGTVFLLPILFVTDDSLFPQSREGWITALILGMTTISNQALILYSLKWLSSGLVATILLLNPIISAILAWIIFAEVLTVLDWLALIVILLGIYVVTLSIVQGNREDTAHPTSNIQCSGQADDRCKIAETSEFITDLDC